MVLGKFMSLCEFPAVRKLANFFLVALLAVIGSLIIFI